MQKVGRGETKVDDPEVASAVRGAIVGAKALREPLQLRRPRRHPARPPRLTALADRDLRCTSSPMNRIPASSLGWR